MFSLVPVAAEDSRLLCRIHHPDDPCQVFQTEVAVQPVTQEDGSRPLPGSESLGRNN